MIWKHLSSVAGPGAFCKPKPPLTTHCTFGLARLLLPAVGSQTVVWGTTQNSAFAVFFNFLIPAKSATSADRPRPRILAFWTSARMRQKDWDQSARCMLTCSWNSVPAAAVPWPSRRARHGDYPLVIPGPMGVWTDFKVQSSHFPRRAFPNPSFHVSRPSGEAVTRLPHSASAAPPNSQNPVSREFAGLRAGWVYIRHNAV